MDRIGTKAGKRQETAVFEQRARHHVRTRDHSGRIRGYPARVRGWLSNCRSRHRHVSLGFSLIGSIIVFSFLVRLISFCKFQWRRGGISGDLEGRLPLFNVPRRLADNGSGEERMQALDRQCVRLFGSAQQENTRQSSVVLGAGDGHGRSQHQMPRHLHSGGGTASSAEGVSGYAGTGGNGARPAEGLQESFQGGRDGMGPRRDGWPGVLGSDGRVASSGGGQGMELQLIPPPTRGVNGVDDGDSCGEECASYAGDGRQRLTRTWTGNHNNIGNTAPTAEEPPPYEEALRQSGPMRVDSLHAHSQLDDRHSPVGAPPSYLEVLAENMNQLRALRELMGGGGSTEAGIPSRGSQNDNPTSRSPPAGPHNLVRPAPGLRTSPMFFCGILFVVVIICVIIPLLPSMQGSQALRPTTSGTDLGNVTTAPVRNTSLPGRR